MSRAAGVVLCAALVLAGSVTRVARAEDPARSFVAWRADHHMHLGSAALQRASDTLCAKLGEEECSAPKPATATAESAIAELNKVGAAKGVVLSQAYMFGSPWLHDQHFDVAALMRAENSFVAREVARFPGRLVGFFSVAPLSRSAASEVRYWMADGRLQGMKLHLANSDIDFRNVTQLRQLARIVGLAGAHHLPMVIHVKGGKFLPQDAEAFIRTVMPAAGDSWVQIAHAGGWGDYDAPTARILKVWSTHVVAHDPAVAHVLFDLAYVVRPSISEVDAHDLAQQMRVIGLDRFVLGSDYDEATPQETDDLARAKLPLTDAEWRVVAGNCAPWAC